ncbi:MAG: hypothetical protein HPY73_07430 [Methanomassiliicoccales archaeon]|nr:MAG: hypothetical protein HPY73_07430 [Methanomassiliicoccales archaeon]
MNKKVMIGAVLGAVVLFAVVASLATALPGNGDAVIAEKVGEDPKGQGDCDRTQQQLRDRDMLRDGSCCDQDGDRALNQEREKKRDGTCGDAAGPVRAGEAVMYQAMEQVQEQVQTCAANGNCPEGYAYQYQHANQNGKA